ncbi:hypothetical protein HN018_27045 (plasmid) [Lichenicola cladoniae]|uniref:Uncharacterized protein n=1 Tax=Lichenicola cladoniae TaxID=1484109 RepID=A0A6M8HZG3_9PROT|nr:hypothetical protein [Lichenicola cladoniae]NPD69595.1 hypothetical protein [Acetobacteraceae bacterium]QKE93782.1 hypothetical protein HN018_27045 [Lichenicola cladoniae]
MTMNTQWNNVDVLIPRRIHDARNAAMSAARFDLTALIEALPVASITLSAASLADADAEQGREWLAAVIRALPTQGNMEPEHGVA